MLSIIFEYISEIFKLTSYPESSELSFFTAFDSTLRLKVLEISKRKLLVEFLSSIHIYSDALPVLLKLILEIMPRRYSNCGFGVVPWSIYVLFYSLIILLSTNLSLVIY